MINLNKVNIKMSFYLIKFNHNNKKTIRQTKICNKNLKYKFYHYNQFHQKKLIIKILIHNNLYPPIGPAAKITI